MTKITNCTFTKNKVKKELETSKKKPNAKFSVFPLAKLAIKEVNMMFGFNGVLVLLGLAAVVLLGKMKTGLFNNRSLSWLEVWFSYFQFARGHSLQFY